MAADDGAACAVDVSGGPPLRGALSLFFTLAPFAGLSTNPIWIVFCVCMDLCTCVSTVMWARNLNGADPAFTNMLCAGFVFSGLASIGEAATGYQRRIINGSTGVLDVYVQRTEGHVSPEELLAFQAMAKAYRGEVLFCAVFLFPFTFAATYYWEICTLPWWWYLFGVPFTGSGVAMTTRLYSVNITLLTARAEARKVKHDIDSVARRRDDTAHELISPLGSGTVTDDDRSWDYARTMTQLSGFMYTTVPSCRDATAMALVWLWAIDVINALVFLVGAARNKFTARRYIPRV